MAEAAKLAEDLRTKGARAKSATEVENTMAALLALGDDAAELAMPFDDGFLTAHRAKLTDAKRDFERVSKLADGGNPALGQNLRDLDSDIRFRLSKIRAREESIVTAAENAARG